MRGQVERRRFDDDRGRYDTADHGRPGTDWYDDHHDPRAADGPGWADRTGYYERSGGQRSRSAPGHPGRAGQSGPRDQRDQNGPRDRRGQRDDPRTPGGTSRGHDGRGPQEGRGGAYERGGGYQTQGGRPTGPGGPGSPGRPGRPNGPGSTGGAGPPADSGWPGRPGPATRGSAGGMRSSVQDYSDQPTPPPGLARRATFGAPGAFTGPPASSSASSSARPPAQRGENWLAWVAFMVGIAVLSGAAGYALNRVTAGSGGTPAARTTPTTGARTPGTGPTDPSVAGPGQATGPTAEQVAIILAGQGLPLRTTVVYTAQNDPDQLLGHPGGYTGRIAFSDSRISASEIAGARPDAIERGGAIEVFADPAAAQARGSRLSAPGTGGDPPAEYTFVHGRVVLRLSLILPETMAGAYRSALAQIGAGS